MYTFKYPYLNFSDYKIKINKYNINKNMLY